MIYSNYPFTLDIHGVVSQISFPVSLNDTARSLLISLTDGGKPYEISDGCRAVLAAVKPDGTRLFNDCIIVGNKVIRYDFTPQTSSVTGKVDCEVRLYGTDGNLVTSPRFTIVVYEGLLDESILSVDEKTTIDSIILSEQQRVEAEAARVEAEAAREEAEQEREGVAEEAEEIANRAASVLENALKETCLHNGSGDISVEQGVYAKAISECSGAFGDGTLAGSKGFRITFLNHHGNGEVFFYLDGYDGGYEVGDEVTIRINSYYDRCGIIQESDNSEVTVKLYDGVTISDDWINNPIDDQLTLRVPDKPNVGNIDVGVCASAFGSGTSANGAYSHAEGCIVKADGKYAHAEGVDTAAVYASHAEGRESKALGQTSHAEGWKTEAIGNYSHTEGHNTKATKDNAHAEGWNTTASGESSHAEGNETEASGTRSHAEGYGSKATANFTHAEGKKTTASGESAHAEGDGTASSARATHTEGVNTTASAQMAHAEGYNTKATAEMAHAEGANTTASGKRSHAEGNGTTASGERSHAEGDGTTASGAYSHSEGLSSNASGNKSHAEGDASSAIGDGSHSEGVITTAKGGGSHSEGYRTNAKGDYSHAEGYGTISNGTAQHVQGKYNVEDTQGKYAFIVGNGTGENTRSNAFAVRWDGSIEVEGDIVGNVTDAKNVTERINGKKISDIFWENTTIVKGSYNAFNADEADHAATADSATNANYAAIAGTAYDVSGGLAARIAAIESALESLSGV